MEHYATWECQRKCELKHFQGKNQVLETNKLQMQVLQQPQLMIVCALFVGTDLKCLGCSKL